MVCRLSMDGITVISNYGMTDYFRDKLSTATSGGIKAGWDAQIMIILRLIPENYTGIIH